jgi:hypothetical protein
VQAACFGDERRRAVRRSGGFDGDRSARSDERLHIGNEQLHCSRAAVAISWRERTSGCGLLAHASSTIFSDSLSAAPANSDRLQTAPSMSNVQHVSPLGPTAQVKKTTASEGATRSPSIVSRSFAAGA